MTSPGLSVTEPGWGGQSAEPTSPVVPLRPPPHSAWLMHPSLEPFLHLASLTRSSADSPLPTSLTTASGLPYRPAEPGACQAEEEGVALVARPHKVNGIRVHRAKIAKKLDMKKLGQST